MPPSSYRILLVELDHHVGNLLQRQVLEPLGYQVIRVESVADAMDKISSFSPDLIIVNLSLPGLSGNDLLVALTSQGIDIPVVVMAKKGMENNIIRAFRLGAYDYLSLPLRETEVVTVTERILNQRKAHDTRDQLISELKQTNLALEHKLSRLTETLSLSKAGALVSDLRDLYKRILEVALQATETQRGWILMRQGKENTFIVAAHLNSSDDPKSEELPWEHNTKQLAAIAAEFQSLDSEKPQVFELSSPGGSSLVGAIQSHKTLIGFLIVTRSDPAPFNSFQQSLMEAIVNFAACSITKLRLIQAVYKSDHNRRK